MRINGGRVFTGSGFEETCVYINDGRFVTADVYVDDGMIIDAAGAIVAPGLIDLHFHGCVGHDFCDGTQESLSALASYEASRGVTAICPATMTYPEDKLAGIMNAAAAFKPQATEAALVGINMEGPFISPHKVGAQNPAYVQPCDAAMLARLQERAAGLIKLVDVAPEEPGALEFIEATRDQARISVAHTCAGYEEARAAFEAGARQVTHLYNAMPSLHHRDPGPIAAAAEAAAVYDDFMAEIICDGVHIHPAMVRLAFAMFGAEHMVLISDTMEAAGMPDGEYSLGGQAVTVRGNRATLHDGTLAGSNTDLAACLQTAVNEMGIPLEDALRAATVNPARALGIDRERGSIAPGKVADAVLFDDQLNVMQVVLRGKVI